MAIIVDKEALSRNRLVNRGILEKWHGSTWEDFVVHDGKTDRGPVLSLVQDYVNHPEIYISKGIGMFLYGTNGTGKTLLMNVAFKNMLDADNEVLITSFPSVISNYTKNWRGEGIWKQLANTPILGIEEIGKGFIASGVAKELAIAALDDLLRYRVQRVMPTWFTTNMMPEDILDTFGPSLNSLFKESCIVLEVPGRDFRTEIFAKNNPTLAAPAKPKHNTSF